MAIIRLLYFSEATRDMNLSDMKDILDVARSNNNEQNICGMLCYDNNYFLQILEGEAKDVTELFLTIADDDRHHTVVIMGVQPIEKPAFPNWNMGYAGSSDVMKEQLKALNLEQFDPTKLSNQQASRLLFELSKSQTKI